MPATWKKDLFSHVFSHKNRCLYSGFYAVSPFKLMILNCLCFIAFLKLVDEMIYDTIINGFFGIHPVIPVKILKDLLYFFTAIVSKDSTRPISLAISGGKYRVITSMRRCLRRIWATRPPMKAMPIIK